MEHAVIITFPFSEKNRGSAWELEVLGSLGDDIADIVAEAGVGEYDGYDVGAEDYVFYLYGPDADALFKAIKRVVKRQAWPMGVTIVSQYGEPGEKEVYDRFPASS